MHFDTDIMMQHCRLFWPIWWFCILIYISFVYVTSWWWFLYSLLPLQYDHIFALTLWVIYLWIILNWSYSIIYHSSDIPTIYKKIDTRKQDNVVCECIINDESWIFTNGNLRLNWVHLAFAFDSTQIDMKTNAKYN